MLTAQPSGTMVPMSEHHHPLTPTELLSYMRAQPWAIEATVTPQGAPQAAVIGVAVTDRFELLLDTVTQSRKHQNLVKNPRVASLSAGSTSAPFNTKALPRFPRKRSCSTCRPTISTVSPTGPPARLGRASCTGACGQPGSITAISTSTRPSSKSGTPRRLPAG